VDTFLQQVVNGLTLGCVYAVVALGYTMVYGIIQLINFAHGEVVMIGCMVAFSVIVALAGTGMPPLVIVGLGALVAVPVCMAVGFIVERAAYKPLRHAPRLAPLITAIGVSIILQHLALLVWSRNIIAFPQIIELKLYHFGSSESSAAISNVQVAIIIASVVMMAGLLALVYRTKMGIAMRAVSQNPQVAGLMGVDIDRVISITFVIGAGPGRRSRA
jgi:branched-chain amino acid transport system permease protein